MDGFHDPPMKFLETPYSFWEWYESLIGDYPPGGLNGFCFWQPPYIHSYHAPGRHNSDYTHQAIPKTTAHMSHSQTSLYKA